MTGRNGQIIIGIDLGHAETAAARAIAGDPRDPDVIELVPGQRAIPTAVARRSDGTILIGSEAILSKDAKDLALAFKSVNFAGEGSRAATQALVAGILHRLRVLGHVSAESHPEFMVGVPSRWSELARLQYLEVMKQAGLSNVQVISESRAALLGAGLPYERARSHVLIVDVGSSTTDLTYLRDLAVQQEALTELGHNALGGGLIDEALLAQVLDRSTERSALMRVFDRDPSARLRALYAVRKAKEDYFTNEAVYRNQPMISFHVVGVQPRLMLDIEIDRATMDRALNEPSTVAHDQASSGTARPALGWVAAFRSLLCDAKTGGRLSQVDTLVLTGGASRMGVVQEIAREIFPDAYILMGPEPELAVAKGLAKARRLDYQTAHFKADARETLNEERIRAAVDRRFPDWQDSVAALYADRLQSILTASLIHWRDSPNKQMTLRDMQDHIRDTVQRWMEDPETDILVANSFLGWSNRVLVDLRPTLMALMERNFIPIAQIDLNPIPPRAGIGSLDDFRFFGGVGDLTKPAMTSVVAALASLVGFTIDALLHGVTLGLVGISMGLVGFIAGSKGEGKVTDWIFTTPIKARVGHTILASVLSNKRIEALVAKQMPTLKKDLKARLDGAERGRIEARVIDAVNKALGAVSEQARLVIAGA
ncbi:MAG: Hsp70 family protein [Hyphomicrobiaceae bacterium]